MAAGSEGGGIMAIRSPRLKANKAREKPAS